MNDGTGRSLGELLVSLRNLTGMTQEELAGASGVSARSISDLERDRVSRPRRRSLELLAAALELGQDQTRTLIAISRGASVSWPDGVAGDDATGTVPRQLPTAVRHFIGREGELDALADVAGEAVTAGGTVVISAIDGMAGIGKTALAVHAAHRLAGKFPDGQLFIDLHGYTQGHEPRTAGDALDWLLHALGVPPQRIPHDVEERAALYRERLADTATMIVLDNAVSEEQVRPLLPGAARCLVLITSRRRLKGLDDAHTLSLDLLPRADAIALLRAVAGPARVAPDDRALAEIAELCGLLPLALRIAAALLRHRSAWTAEYLAGLLRHQHERLTALSAGDRDLGAVFDLSYQSLTEAHRRVFRCLGLIPGPDTDAYATAALTATDPPAAARLLEALVDHNLLIQHLPGRYRLHDLIRLHARSLASRDPAQDRDAAFGRLLDYYQHTAGRADALIARSPRAAPAGPTACHAPALTDPAAARSWLRTERPNLLAALRHSISHASHERTIALTVGLDTLLCADGPWPLAIDLHVAAASAAHGIGDDLSQANALTRLGDTRGMTGDFPGAVADLERALQLYRDLGDRLGQANALTHLGDVRGLTGDFPGAVADLEQALSLYRDLGERLGQANALGRLGERHRVAGEFPDAARELREALGLYRDVGDRHGQANTLARLGDVQCLTGDLPDAVRDLEQALRLSEDLGERHGQAYALTWLGMARRAAGDLPGAVRDLERALQLFRDFAEPFGQVSALTWLGRTRLSIGDCHGAACHLEEALELSRRLGAPGSEAWVLNHRAAVLMATSDFSRALALYHDALRLARETRQLDDEALALEGIGECHLRTAEIEVGTGRLEQALDIFQRLGMKPDADRVRVRLAGLGP